MAAFLHLFEAPEGNACCIHLLDFNGSTSGSYGYGGEGERAASNPASYPHIEMNDVFNPAMEKALLGHGLILVPISAGGSCHEKWLNISAYVTAPKDLLVYTAPDGEDYTAGDYSFSPPAVQERRVSKWMWPPGGWCMTCSTGSRRLSS